MEILSSLMALPNIFCHVSTRALYITLPLLCCFQVFPRSDGKNQHLKHLILNISPCIWTKIRLYIKTSCCVLNMCFSHWKGRTKTHWRNQKEFGNVWIQSCSSEEEQGAEDHGKLSSYLPMQVPTLYPPPDSVWSTEKGNVENETKGW